MKILSLIITVSALLFASQSNAQVLTTGEPATVSEGNRPLPGNPKSMTVADEGASSGYIIGKRVDPDRKKNQARSPSGSAVGSADTTRKSMRRSQTRSMRRKARQDSVR